MADRVFENVTDVEIVESIYPLITKAKENQIGFHHFRDCAIRVEAVREVKIDPNENNPLHTVTLMHYPQYK